MRSSMLKNTGKLRKKRIRSRRWATMIAALILGVTTVASPLAAIPADAMAGDPPVMTSDSEDSGEMQDSSTDFGAEGFSEIALGLQQEKVETGEDGILHILKSFEYEGDAFHITFRIEGDAALMTDGNLAADNTVSTDGENIIGGTTPADDEDPTINNSVSAGNEDSTESDIVPAEGMESAGNGDSALAADENNADNTDAADQLPDDKLDFQVVSMDETSEEYEAVVSYTEDASDDEKTLLLLDALSYSLTYDGVRVDLSDCKVTAEITPTEALVTSLEESSAVSAAYTFDGEETENRNAQTGVTLTAIEVVEQVKQETAPVNALNTMTLSTGLQSKAMNVTLSDNNLVLYASAAGRTGLTVQFYANKETIVTGNRPEDAKDSLELINTAGRKLPTNAIKSPDTINMYLNNGGDIIKETTLTKMYNDKSFDAFPNINEVEISNHELAEVWVLKAGRSPESVDKEDWEIYKACSQESGSEHNHPALDASEYKGYSCSLADTVSGAGSVIRLVYDAEKSTYTGDVAFYDYDITDGAGNKSANGINSPINYGELSCGQVAHVHTDACRLTCDHTEHIHTNACRELAYEHKEHTHTTACKQLSCELPEHTHTDNCGPIKVICGKHEHEEMPGAYDGSSHECWTWYQGLVGSDLSYDSGYVMTCMDGIPADHKHDYGTQTGAGMDNIPGCLVLFGVKDGVKHYICKEQLNIKSQWHQHTEECYKRECTCGFDTEHTHTEEDCYSKETYCGKEAHVHEDSCYKEEYSCGREAHKHDASCRADTEQCGKAVHSHTDACFTLPGENISKLAHGNGGNRTSLGEVTWNDYHINQNSGLDGSYKSCTFEMVKKLDANGNIVYADGIAAPNFFGEGYAIGRDDYGDFDLVFDRAGDTYTLTGVNRDGVGVVLSQLDYFRQASGLWTNLFWPMENANIEGKDDYFPEAGDDGKKHNSYFGMHYEIDFTFEKDYVGPLDYYFYGDDDFWVFLDGQLICDLGGVHSTAGEYVNLWDWLDRDTDFMRQHTLSVFYMERGAYGSTCWMQFTLPSAKFTEPSVDPGEEYTLAVKKTVNGETTDVPANESFKFKIKFESKYAELTQAYTCEITDGKKYFNLNGDEIIEGGSEKEQVYIKSGDEFLLKAGQSINVKDLPEGTIYTIEEIDSGQYQPAISAGDKTKVIIDDKKISGSIDDDLTVTYNNESPNGGFELPETGGQGTDSCMAAGLLLLILSTGFLYRKKYI